MNNPQAGWYKDTNNPSLQRWWDGDTWTHHIQPGPVEITGTATDARPTWEATSSNSAAVAGFSLGLAAFFLFNVPVFGLLLSLSAGVASGIGLSKQQSGMAKKYRIFAITGLILGIVYTLMALLSLSGSQ